VLPDLVQSELLISGKRKRLQSLFQETCPQIQLPALSAALSNLHLVAHCDKPVPPPKLSTPPRNTQRESRAATSPHPQQLLLSSPGTQIPHRQHQISRSRSLPRRLGSNLAMREAVKKRVPMRTGKRSRWPSSPSSSCSTSRTSPPRSTSRKRSSRLAETSLKCST
jgi:hypothetical protein